MPPAATPETARGAAHARPGRACRFRRRERRSSNNLPALEAAFREIDELGIGHILCCGDFVGYGPHPRECFELLRQRNIPCDLGNHDLHTLQARDNKAGQEAADELRSNAVWTGILHPVAELRQEDFDWMQDLPSFLKLLGSIVGHAAMHDLENWPYLVDDADITAAQANRSHQQWSDSDPRNLLRVGKFRKAAAKNDLRSDSYVHVK